MTSLTTNTGMTSTAGKTGESGDASPELSVVVPVFNERDNIRPLIVETCTALRELISFEVIYVDDCSNDGSEAYFQQLKAEFAELRVIRHESQSGQSTAVYNGVCAARAAWIATMDGDGQNDPADLPKLWQAKQVATITTKLFAGWRQSRKDTLSKRVASKLANAIRSRLLNDATPDTGCGIKLFERAAFMKLPYFNHMHRYLPALMQRAGFQTISVPVNHRPRGAGSSKYTNLKRLWVGLSDLWGVAWLIRRSKRTMVREL
jgi:dolichol-phosphate mannosyltransferase